MYASIRELRLHTKELLDAARRGEVVIVKYHKQEYIQLVPVENKKALEQDIGFGMWADNSHVNDVDSYINQLREPRRHVD